MISSRMNRCMTVFVLALICATAWAAEPNEPPIPLVFELGPVTDGPLRGPALGNIGKTIWGPFISHKAIYVAAISVVGPADFLPLPRTGRMLEFLRFARQRGDLLERQKAFLDAANWAYLNAGATTQSAGRVIILSPLIERADPNGPERILLYAVTQEDAQKMAQAFFQFAMQAFRAQVRELEQNVRGYREELESTKKKIAEAQERLAAAQKSLADVEKTVPYWAEDEAHQAIGELDRMLNAAQIEIAGIRAKMDRILGYRKERPPGLQLSPEAVAKLDMMLVEEDIALQGATARKQMATSLREQAGRYVDLKATLVNAPVEERGLAEKLKDAQKNLVTFEGNLATTRLKEPKIPDKIVIYPIQWAGQAAQN